MKEEKEHKPRNYGPFALAPVLLFICLYIGCGVVFTLLKEPHPFNIMSRYTAVLLSVLAALVFFEPHRNITEKTEIYYKRAGKKGIVLLGMIVMMAGGFASAAEAIGGKVSLVNICVSFIPIHFLVPGIFVMCAIISTCIGSSMGTLVTMVPIACSLATGAGLNEGMLGAAAIAGAFFGDNLSMISDTTICATKGVGAEMKDKFQVNVSLALPAALITVVLYIVIGVHSSAQQVNAGDYEIMTILPYLLVLVLAVMGLDVVLVLALGIMLCGIIGVFGQGITFFEWAKAVSSGMEGMFWLAVFATMISGLIGLVEYYGGISWMIQTISGKIRSKRGCESIIGLLAMAVSGVIVNNTMAIIITAPVAKELGKKYQISPKVMASILDIGACLAMMVIPHGSAVMMVQEATGCSYLDIMKYQYYPVLLMIFTIGMIWLSRKKQEGK
ncbi:MAG: Na+/H+ antiporter NhaC family protein [Lachnospiraceae bacterium]